MLITSKSTGNPGLATPRRSAALPSWDGKRVGSAGGARAIHWAVAASLIALVGAAGCSEQNMAAQPKVETYQASDFFPDGQSARQPVAGTVARGEARVDQVFYEGMKGDLLVDSLPPSLEVTSEFLARGQQRFDIYCSPCHDRTGSANGVIVQRGFPQPPTFHQDRLRDAPIGHFYHVMTHGYGVMYSYAARVTPEDRWAVAAYIRALQLSHHATMDDVPADKQAALKLEGKAP